MGALFALIFSSNIASAQSWQKPFWSSSIWNRQLPSYRVLVDANMNRRDLITYDLIHDLYLQGSWPNRDVYFNNGWSDRARGYDSGNNLRMKNNYIVHKEYEGPYGGTPNSTFAFMMLDRNRILQGQVLCRPTNTGPVYMPWWAYNKFQRLYGDGRKDNQGHGATGLSAIGGTLRNGDLTVTGKTPDGVIKIMVNARRYLHYDWNTKKGSRWPAGNSDNYREEYGGSNPALKMGSLLTFDGTTQVRRSWMKTDPGRRIYDTVKKYGAYIVEDSNRDAYALVMTEDEYWAFRNRFGYSPHQYSGSWHSDINDVMNALEVVDNNNS